MRLHNRWWTQVGGDMNPSQHGATLARLDGEAIEMREIQPVRDYVSDGEAVDVGFPFWTREAWYAPADLDPTSDHVIQAARSCDLGLECATPLEIACALMTYGHAVEEGQGGFARDVFPPPDKAYWFGCRHPHGWRHLADEDVEWRRTARGHRMPR